MISSNYFLFEPTTTFGIGINNVMLVWFIGFPMRLSYRNNDNDYNSARTFPVNASASLRFIIGRDQNPEK